VRELTGWSRDLRVTADGDGVVGMIDVVGLRMLADRTGLTGGLSAVLAKPGFHPVHDRGRVLTALSDREREVLALMAEGPFQPGHRRPALPHRQDRRIPGTQHLLQTRPHPCPDDYRRVLAVLTHLRGAGTP
jgi:hypothetical protein